MRDDDECLAIALHHPPHLVEDGDRRGGGDVLEEMRGQELIDAVIRKGPWRRLRPKLLLGPEWRLRRALHVPHEGHVREVPTIHPQEALLRVVTRAEVEIEAGAYAAPLRCVLRPWQPLAIRTNPRRHQSPPLKPSTYSIVIGA